jgi:endonuclease/exonuclease/phosphatase family metal-dependent hydrolase
MVVASLNIRAVPLLRSRLAARYRAIGAFFEASDVEVVCFQEVLSYGHLALLARQMRSFRYASVRLALPGPAGGVVTFCRVPVSATLFHGFGPVAARIPWRARLRARMKGVLVTRLAHPGLAVINTHPLANTDGDWSAENRFAPVHRAQLGTLARVVADSQVPVVVCGDFNVDRDSVLFSDFASQTGLADAFGGRCPPTFRADYLPAGATPHCIDFILTRDGIKASSAEVLFAGKQELRGGPGYVSDHLGLRARLHVPDA